MSEPAEKCGAEDRDFDTYVCTLPKGHTGEHEARDENGELVSSWNHDDRSDSDTSGDQFFKDLEAAIEMMKGPPPKPVRLPFETDLAAEIAKAEAAGADGIYFQGCGMSLDNARSLLATVKRGP